MIAICGGIPKVNSTQGVAGVNTTKHRKTVTSVDQIRIETMIKISERLPHMQLKTSHTTIEKGTALINVSQGDFIQEYRFP